MITSLRFRLSMMMFVEYFIWGAWYVTLGTWLSSALRMTGGEIALIAGCTAVGALVSPFAVGLIADRYFATQHVLAFLHLAGAALLWAVSRQTSFVAVYALLVLYALCFMPTLALTNSLSFRHIDDPGKQFGLLRIFGSVGWIVAGLVVGASHREATPWPIRLAAIASAVMGLYCFTLPDTPPNQTGAQAARRGIFPAEAVNILKRRSVAVFAIASVLICIPLQFYYAFTNLFLNEIGVQNAAGKMTGGQISELLGMTFLGWSLRRFGVRGILLGGMLAWVVRYVCFAWGNAGSAIWLLWIGIILHGFCYDFFFVAGQLYIDRQASAAYRASAQGLLSFLTYGLGMFGGSWVSSGVMKVLSERQGDAVVYHWHEIWLFCAACSAVVLVFFALGFREESGPDAKETTGALSAEPLLP